MADDRTEVIQRAGASRRAPAGVVARALLVVLLLSGLSALSGCGGGGSETAVQTSERTTSAAGAPCGRVGAGATSYRHVIWLWMENRSYDRVIGAHAAPYLDSLAADCGLATNYHNVTHPSLPNYIAATSGLGGHELDPFRSDCNPSKKCSTRAKSIFAQTPSWRAYQESMPAPCDRSNAAPYAVRHNPPLYFSSLTGCAERDLPLSALVRDLSGDSLPAFSFITPNLCHDTHDCPVGKGDHWLANEVPRILGSRAYRAGQTVLFITFDEGEGGSSNDCASNQSDAGCQVAMVVVSPSTPRGRRSGQLFNHYSLLGTTENLLRLPALGNAGAASSMAKSFGLTP